MGRRITLQILVLVALLSVVLSGATYILWPEQGWSLDRIAGYGTIAAPLAYMVFEYVATVLPPVPNPISAVFAGYFFGTVPGLLYTILANALGSATLYYGGVYGKKAVARWYMRKQKQIERVDRFLSRENGFASLILVRFSPLFPNDVLSLLLGFTSISFRRFILTTTLGYSVPFLLLARMGAVLAGSGGDVSSARLWPLFLLLTLISVLGMAAAICGASGREDLG